MRGDFVKIQFKLKKTSSLVLALIIATTDLFSSPALASLATVQSSRPALMSPSGNFSLTEVEIPAALGELQETFTGKKDKTVFLIQDAHAVPSAQRNIQKIIEYLQINYAVDRIALEGISSPLDPELFRQFPDKEILRKALDEYYDRGELTGSMASAILSEREALHEGIEDPELYRKGLAFYLAAREREAAISRKLTRWKKRLEWEKRFAYSKELLQVDRAVQAFEEEKIDFADVLRVLFKFNKPANGSALSLLRSEIVRDEKLHKDVEIEVKRLAEKMRKHLVRQSPPFSAKDDQIKNAIASFNQKYQEFRNSQITSGEFALFLKDLLKEYPDILSPSDKPWVFSRKLKALMSHHRRIKELESSKLFEEFEDYVHSVKGSLFRDHREKVLDEESRFLTLMKKLNRLELTRKEWQEFKRRLNANAFSGDPASGRLEHKGQAQGQEALQRLKPILRYQQPRLDSSYLPFSGGSFGENSTAEKNNITINSPMTIFIESKMAGENHTETKDAARIISEKRNRDFEIASRRYEVIMEESMTQTEEEFYKNNNIIDKYEIRHLTQFHRVFYENAEKRDAAFLKRLMEQDSALKKAGAKSTDSAINMPVIFVAGGFHTDGVTEHFKKYGFSYVLIRPAIGNIPDKLSYRNQMIGKVSWSRYFQVQDGTINLYEAFVRALRDRLLGDAGAPVLGEQSQSQDNGQALDVQNELQYQAMLLKQWRDQIIRLLAEKKQITKAGAYTRFIDELTGDSQIHAHIPTDSRLKTRWQKRYEHFTEGIRRLESAGRLTERNILKLLPRAGMLPLAGGNAGLAPREPTYSRAYFPGIYATSAESASLRHEIRKTDAEKSSVLSAASSLQRESDKPKSANHLPPPASYLFWKLAVAGVYAAGIADARSVIRNGFVPYEIKSRLVKSKNEADTFSWKGESYALYQLDDFPAELIGEPGSGLDTGQKVRSETRPPVPGRDREGKIILENGSKFEFVHFNEDTIVKIGLPGGTFFRLRYKPDEQIFILSAEDPHDPGVVIHKRNFKPGERILLGRYEPPAPGHPQLVHGLVRHWNFSRFHAEIHLSEKNPVSVSFRDILSTHNTEITVHHAAHIDWPEDSLLNPVLTIRRAVPSETQISARPVRVQSADDTMVDFGSPASIDAGSVTMTNWQALRRGRLTQDIRTQIEYFGHRFSHLKGLLQDYFGSAENVEDLRVQDEVRYLHAFGDILITKVFNADGPYYYEKPASRFLVRDAEKILLKLERMLLREVFLQTAADQAGPMFFLHVGTRAGIPLSANASFAEEALKQAKRWSRRGLSEIQLLALIDTYLEEKRSVEANPFLRSLTPVAGTFYYHHPRLDGEEISVTGEVHSGAVLEIPDLKPKELAVLKAFITRQSLTDLEQPFSGVLRQHHLKALLLWLYTLSHLQGAFDADALRQKALDVYRERFPEDSAAVHFGSLLEKVFSRYPNEKDFRWALFAKSFSDHEVFKQNGFLYLWTAARENPSSVTEIPLAVIPEGSGIPLYFPESGRRIWFKHSKSWNWRWMTDQGAVLTEGEGPHEAALDLAGVPRSGISPEFSTILPEPLRSPSSESAEQVKFEIVNHSLYGSNMPALRIISSTPVPRILGFPVPPDEPADSVEASSLVNFDDLPSRVMNIESMVNLLGIRGRGEQQVAPQFNAEGGIVHRVMIYADTEGRLRFIDSMGGKKTLVWQEPNSRFIEDLKGALSSLEGLGLISRGLSLTRTDDGRLRIEDQTGRSITMRLNALSMQALAQALNRMIRILARPPMDPPTLFEGRHELRVETDSNQAVNRSELRLPVENANEDQRRRIAAWLHFYMQSQQRKINGSAEEAVPLLLKSLEGVDQNPDVLINLLNPLLDHPVKKSKRAKFNAAFRRAVQDILAAPAANSSPPAQASRPKSTDPQSGDFDILKWSDEIFLPARRDLIEKMESGGLNFGELKKWLDEFITPLAPEFGGLGVVLHYEKPNRRTFYELMRKIEREILIPRGVLLYESLYDKKIHVETILSEEQRTLTSPQGEMVSFYLTDAPPFENTAPVAPRPLVKAAIYKDGPRLIGEAVKKFKFLQKKLSQGKLATSATWREAPTAYFFNIVPMSLFGPLKPEVGIRLWLEDILRLEEYVVNNIRFLEEKDRRPLMREMPDDYLARILSMLKPESQIMKNLEFLLSKQMPVSERQVSKGLAILHIEAELRSLQLDHFPVLHLLSILQGPVLGHPLGVPYFDGQKMYLSHNILLAALLAEPLMGKGRHSTQEWHEYLKNHTHNLGMFDKLIREAASRVYEAEFIGVKERVQKKHQGKEKDITQEKAGARGGSPAMTMDAAHKAFAKFSEHKRRFYLEIEGERYFSWGNEIETIWEALQVHFADQPASRVEEFKTIFDKFMRASLYGPRLRAVHLPSMLMDAVQLPPDQVVFYQVPITSSRVRFKLGIKNIYFAFSRNTHRLHAVLIEDFYGTGEKPLVLLRHSDFYPAAEAQIAPPSVDAEVKALEKPAAGEVPEAPPVNTMPAVSAAKQEAKKEISPALDISKMLARFIRSMIPAKEKIQVTLLRGGHYQTSLDRDWLQIRKDTSVFTALDQFFKVLPAGVKGIRMTSGLSVKALEKALSQIRISQNDYRNREYLVRRLPISKTSTGPLDHSLWEDLVLFGLMRDEEEAGWILEIEPVYTEIEANYGLYFTREGFKEFREKAVTTKQYKTKIASNLNELLTKGVKGEPKKGPLVPLYTIPLGRGSHMTKGRDRLFYHKDEALKRIYIVAFRRKEGNADVEGQEAVEEIAGNIRKGLFNRYIMANAKEWQEFLREKLHILIRHRSRQELRSKGGSAAKLEALIDQAQGLFEQIPGRPFGERESLKALFQPEKHADFLFSRGLLGKYWFKFKVLNYFLQNYPAISRAHFQHIIQTALSEQDVRFMKAPGFGPAYGRYKELAKTKRGHEQGYSVKKMAGILIGDLIMKNEFQRIDDLLLPYLQEMEKTWTLKEGVLSPRVRHAAYESEISKIAAALRPFLASGEINPIILRARSNVKKPRQAIELSRRYAQLGDVILDLVILHELWNRFGAAGMGYKSFRKAAAGHSLWRSNDHLKKVMLDILPADSALRPKSRVYLATLLEDLIAMLYLDNEKANHDGLQKASEFILAHLKLPNPLTPGDSSLADSAPEEDTKPLPRAELRIQQVEEHPAAEWVQKISDYAKEEMLFKYGALDEDHPASRYVRELFRETLGEESKNYKVVIAPGWGEMNAISFLDGTIILGMLLVKFVKYREELQGILAHEALHIKRRHHEALQWLAERREERLSHDMVQEFLRMAGLARLQEVEADIGWFVEEADKRKINPLGLRVFLDRLDIWDKRRGYRQKDLRHGGLEDRSLNAESIFYFLDLASLSHELNEIPKDFYEELSKIPQFERVHFWSGLEHLTEAKERISIEHKRLAAADKVSPAHLGLALEYIEALSTEGGGRRDASDEQIIKKLQHRVDKELFPRRKWPDEKERRLAKGLYYQFYARQSYFFVKNKSVILEMKDAERLREIMHSSRFLTLPSIPIAADPRPFTKKLLEFVLEKLESEHEASAEIIERFFEFAEAWSESVESLFRQRAILEFRSSDLMKTAANVLSKRPLLITQALGAYKRRPPVREAWDDVFSGADALGGKTKGARKREHEARKIADAIFLKTKIGEPYNFGNFEPIFGEIMRKVKEQDLTSVMQFFQLISIKNAESYTLHKSYSEWVAEKNEDVRRRLLAGYMIFRLFESAVQAHPLFRSLTEIEQKALRLQALHSMVYLHQPVFGNKSYLALEADKKGALILQEREYDHNDLGEGKRNFFDYQMSHRPAKKAQPEPKEAVVAFGDRHYLHQFLLGIEETWLNPRWTRDQMAELYRSLVLTEYGPERAVTRSFSSIAQELFIKILAKYLVRFRRWDAFFNELEALEKKNIPALQILRDHRIQFGLALSQIWPFLAENPDPHELRQIGDAVHFIQDPFLRLELQAYYYRKLWPVLGFDEKLDAFFSKNVSGLFDFNRFHDFVEAEARTQTQLHGIGKRFKREFDQLMRMGDRRAGFAAIFGNLRLNAGNAHDLLLALMETSQSDAALKYALHSMVADFDSAPAWEKDIANMTTEDFIRTANRRIETAGEVENMLLRMDTGAKYVLLRKLLTGDKGLISQPENRRRFLGSLLTKIVQGENDHALVSMMREIIEAMGKISSWRPVYFALQSILVDRIAIPPKRLSSWEPMIDETYPVENRRVKSQIRGRGAKTLEQLAAGARRQAQAPWRHERDLLDYSEELLRSELEKRQGWSREQKDQLLTPLSFVIEFAQKTGALGVRFLQLVPQFADLPERFQEEFSKVYDAVYGQSKLSALALLEREWPGMWSEIASLEERAGGGSLMTVYEVMTIDGKREVLKVLNPNLEFHLENSTAMIREILDVLIKKNPEKFGMAPLIIEEVKQWIERDVRFENFLEKDRIFREANDGFTEPGFRYSMYVPRSRGPENKYFMREEYIEGENLTQWDKLVTEGHDMKEIASLIVKNYVSQLRRGFAHSDVHVGNFRVTPEKKIAILDRNFFLHLNPEVQSLIDTLLNPVAVALLAPEHMVDQLVRVSGGEKLAPESREALISSWEMTREQILAGEWKSITRFLVDLRRTGMTLPLEVTLIFKNLNSLQQMSKKAGFGNLIDAYLYGGASEEPLQPDTKNKKPVQSKNKGSIPRAELRRAARHIMNVMAGRKISSGRLEYSARMVVRAGADSSLRELERLRMHLEDDVVKLINEELRRLVQLMKGFSQEGYAVGYELPQGVADATDIGDFTAAVRSFGSIRQVFISKDSQIPDMLNRSLKEGGILLSRDNLNRGNIIFAGNQKVAGLVATEGKDASGLDSTSRFIPVVGLDEEAVNGTHVMQLVITLKTAIAVLLAHEVKEGKEEYLLNPAELLKNYHLFAGFENSILSRRGNQLAVSAIAVRTYLEWQAARSIRQSA